MKPVLKLDKKLFITLLVFSLTIYFHSAIAQANAVDTATIEKVMGLKGKSNNGEYKITVPQNDLSIEVDGFKIIPAMGLSTWVAFTPAKEGVMFMGDIVLTENDLKAFLPLVKLQKKAKKSFVIVASDLDFNAISDKLVVVPSLLEAHDIIEMEEIERDLGF